ncbi:hypothetical protein PR048_020104 [Dryococelus australis]|uniref:Uncharacterized protein n=1 Tax=Dryococelus australis TaxID=614101 RepID=A0ABQ9H5C8_9NEOP|nr:hypothetical protein PR048_020104 [Dryococelus australis]
MLCVAETPRSLLNLNSMLVFDGFTEDVKKELKCYKSDIVIILVAMAFQLPTPQISFITSCWVCATLSAMASSMIQWVFLICCILTVMDGSHNHLIGKLETEHGSLQTDSENDDDDY